jgi:hypothetical protein
VLSRAALAIALVACSSKNADESAPAPPLVISDGGVDGITTIVGFDPASGMHLDDDGPGKAAAAKRPKGPAVPIGIMLKSEPPGATVLVDGENLGVTPKYWSGVADGNEHEFAFTKPNYALARYRFVPISSGVLHATLERVSLGEAPDAGLEPIIAPKFAPDAAVVAPSPTVITPDAPVRVEPRVDPTKSEPLRDVDAGSPPSEPTGPQP